MSPDELRKLADEATPGTPWKPKLAAESLVDVTRGIADLRFETPDRRLIALAPDLARLCAEYAGAFEQIEKLHPKDRAESAHIARRALAKLSELQP